MEAFRIRVAYISTCFRCLLGFYRPFAELELPGREENIDKMFVSFLCMPVAITNDFRKIYLVPCFVADFQHYGGVQLPGGIKEGDSSELVKEPDNGNDDCAIALH